GQTVAPLFGLNHPLPVAANLRSESPGKTTWIEHDHARMRRSRRAPLREEEADDGRDRRRADRRAEKDVRAELGGAAVLVSRARLVLAGALLAHGVGAWVADGVDARHDR